MSESPPASLPPSHPPEPPQRRRRTGLWVALSFSFIGLFVVGGLMAAVGRTPAEAERVVDETSTTRADVVKAPEPANPAADTEASNNQPAGLTTSRQSARITAENYLSIMAFSRKGLINQLEFEGFSRSDAERAIRTLKPNWKVQAAKSAQNYLDYSPFSRRGLIDQLLFEGFTPNQAVHGVDAAGL